MIARALASDRAELIGDGVLVEPFNTPLRLIVVGAVHVAAPLAAMAKLAGFDVTIVEPRRAWATAERFPDETIVRAWPDAALRELAPDARTAIVTLTHDPKLDDPALVEALASPAFYVGCLGSAKTHAARLKQLGEAGVTRGALRAITRSDRTAHRRALARRDRGRDPRRDRSGSEEARMKFGPVPIDAAAGTTLAHTLRAGHRVLKKGRILDAADLAALLAAGFRELTVARIERGDLDEDAAAAAIGNAIAGAHVRVEDSATGRANLFADTAGLAMLDVARVHALNARDEAITCATLPPFAPVRRGDMVATVKIIPFAVARDEHRRRHHRRPRFDLDSAVARRTCRARHDARLARPRARCRGPTPARREHRRRADRRAHVRSRDRAGRRSDPRALGARSRAGARRVRGDG